MPKNFKTICLATIFMLCMAGHSALAQSRSSRTPMVGGYAPDGVLEPWRSSDVACVEPGLLESLTAKLGDEVRVGDELARLDSATLRAQLEIAMAQASAKGKLDSAYAEVALQERKVESLSAAREKRYSSQSEVDRANADLAIARGRLASELEDKRIMELQVARLKQQLSQRTVVAPIDGTVVELHKELGEYVSPTSPEIVRIIDISKLRTSFFLQAEETTGLRTRGKVIVQLGMSERMEAVVEHISPYADGESGLIEVRVLIDNPNRNIRSSRCSLLLENLPDAT